MSTLTLAAAQPFPTIPVAIVLPVLGALVIALLPKSRPESARLIALLASVGSMALAFFLLATFHKSDAGFQFVTEHTWFSELGISWHAGIDGISLFLVVMTGVLFPIAILAVKPDHDDKLYYFWLLLLEAGCIGTFVALDLFQFFVFFEIVLVPMYMLIGRWGHGNRLYAATKFFLFTMAGSAFMLVGIVSVAVLSARATGDPLTFDLLVLAEQQALATNTARWVFLSFAIAFAVKVPIFGVHTWLPDAHTEAPTAGSVILAGVMLKLGTYGFIRFGLFLFPEAAHFFAPTLVTLGVIGIVYGAVVATMQKDLKRLVAYSSVAHMGFIVLGIFSMTTQGLQGSILQMINHGVSTGALFILVGYIYERRHTRQIAELGGLQVAAPILAAVFMLVMLSSVGLPGLNGFVGEFLILNGSFLTFRWWTVVAATGVILAALYLLWAYQRVFHGEPNAENAEMPDLKVSEGLVIAPLLFLIVFMGVYPKPVLERIEPSVNVLIEHIEENSDFVQPAVATDGVGDLPVAEHSDDETSGDVGEHGEGE